MVAPVEYDHGDLQLACDALGNGRSEESCAHHYRFE
jgi:hypothetical protein